MRKFNDSHLPSFTDRFEFMVERNGRGRNSNDQNYFQLVSQLGCFPLRISIADVLVFTIVDYSYFKLCSNAIPSATVQQREK